ncbi:unnamed protein product [Schistosoma curassoni]|uniref:TIR domain-containing protein n=1 Tax=Schistosoma curassoni TaxID=6186 RepID=A0A183KHL7_9TREM|nr:unnamed protein product [Schistosoma curassoni]VDP56655.1 unnamed protein product [Schistosoma curassoni]
MDHPEPISKRPIEIPQCRKGFNLDEAKNFIDQIMEVFRSLDDMTDLRSMYETGKQLSRSYFDCHTYRLELAQYLTNCDYPAFASKMMKKLNNMGVFKNDDIWFSSFYFYNTTWNFSDIWPEFATALAIAGLPNLLNLNIGHQPYLENLSSKNVYYLIKASLSIIHNIARVPGNTHYFASESVRQALLHLAQREEEFLRCVSTLCLAHIITESEIHLITDISNGGIDLLRILFGYVTSARVSEKRRCHGFQVLELLSSVAALSVLDPVKANLLSSPVNVNLIAGTNNNQSTEHSMTCLSLLKELIETALLSNSSPVSVREAEEAVRILWNTVFDSSICTGVLQIQLTGWLSDTMANHAVALQTYKSLSRAIESINWQLNTCISKNSKNEPTECGPVLLCFSPSNRIAVNRVADRLRDAGIMLNSIPFGPEVIPSVDASATGLTMCAANATNHAQWVESIEQASVMIAFLSDSFRLSPGCRWEVEHFSSFDTNVYSKPIIPVILQPKFKLTGWLNRLISQHPIDFNGKRDPEASYDALISQVKEFYGEAKKRAEAAALVVAQHQLSIDAKKHLTTSGDTGFPGIPNSDVTLNHVNASPAVSSRGSLGPSPGIKREDPIHLSNQIGLQKICNQNMIPVQSNITSRPLATNAWRHAIRPSVRNWSTCKVASWLKFRGLGHVPSQIAGGIDGVLLSQLAGLRIWAPEYFTHCLRSELGLGFADSLRFLEALDELAPEDSDGHDVEDVDDCVDGRPHLGNHDGASSRA